MPHGFPPRLLLTFCAAITARLSLLAQAGDLPPAPKHEDDEIVDLIAIVTTATRSEKAVEKIPGAVEVITRRELDTQYLIAEDLSQALATFVPGFSPSRQKLTQFGESLRGRAPLYLLDGIPQSNPMRAGAREGYFADPLIIDRIEIVSGASAVHGAGATGGIINYITRRPRALGTRQALATQLGTQFHDDDLGWKIGYSLQHQGDLGDAVFFAGAQRRGIAYDGDGNTVGIDNLQGDTMDSFAYDLFAKLGKDFGPQRLQLTANRFDLEGDGDYLNVPGDRTTGQPTTSRRGTPPGSAPRNRVTTLSLDYSHREFFGGTLTAQVFSQEFSALYGAVASITFQDQSIAPIGTLVDQSEIVADKHGAKLTFTRPDTFVSGLELTGGLDWLNDETQQRLAATSRIWVPPLEFESIAPFLQAEYDYRFLTIRGGVRHENATLRVADYQTLAFYGSQPVQGGRLSFDEAVINAGAIVRIGVGLSAFVSYSEGFGLADVGLILRSINTPGRSVSRLVTLVPVLTENREAGFTWRGERATATMSVYESTSDLSSVVRVDAQGLGYVDRVPTRVRGAELTAEWRPVPTVTLNAVAAILEGKTAVKAGDPLDLDLGGRFIGPDKVVLGATWRARPDISLRLQTTTFFDRDINVGRNTGTTRYEEHFNGYTLADAAINWRTRHGTWGLGVENLLDRHYFGYAVQSDAGWLANGNDTYIAGRGRTVTLRYQLEF
jgi:iron complex outermembrane recepter protein